MKILFVHQNFPGQFTHLAPALAARGHEVLALGDLANKMPTTVRTLHYRTPAKKGLTGIGATFVDMAMRGDMVAGACSQLIERTGFRPDVVFGHNGWGEMLFLREIFPEARLINYAEFHYRGRGQDSDFDPEFQQAALKARTATMARSAHILQSMIEADAGLSPTEWQASTFPSDLRRKITVIHDGVDSDEVCPNPEATFEVPGTGATLRTGNEVLTFVNRNLEPYRGYHIFMRALPEVMAARPEAQVVIVGGDQQSYGPAPSGGGTWKERFLDEVKDRLDLSRVHFTGRIPRRQFVALMQVSRVHAYLTYPFVLSWSMIEAMSAGALVVGSRTAPVEEVIRDGVNGRLVGFFDVKGWSETLAQSLADPDADAALRAAARATVLQKYDLKRHCLPRQIDFVEGRGVGMFRSDRRAVPGR
jgi:glycosyltransferase involved in cell wall biosynthesis